MVMPGDNITIDVELITPIALEEQAALRDPRRRQHRRRRRRHQDPRVSRQQWPTTTKIRIRLKAYDHQLLDQVGRRDRRDREAHRARRSPGPIPLPTKINKYTVLRVAARRQEVARAVRDPHPQAPARHPRADAADARRADEARPLGRRRRRDQDLSEPRLTMARSTSTTSQAKKVGELDLADDVFGAEVKEHLLYEVVKAQRAARARRHAHDQEARRGARRRQEAVQAEGHRPRASGLDPRRRTSSAAARRIGPQPRDYAYRPPQQGARRRAAQRRCRCARKRRTLIVVDGFELDDDQDQAARRRPRRRCRRRSSRSSSTTRATTTCAVGRATCRSRPVPAARGLNVYDLLRHDHLVISADAAKALEARCLEQQADGGRSRCMTPAARSSSARSSPRRATRLARPAADELTEGSRRSVRGRARRQQDRDPATPSRRCSTSTVVDVRTLIVRGKEKRMGRGRRQAVRTGRRRSSPSQRATHRVLRGSVEQPWVFKHTSRPRRRAAATSRRDFAELHQGRRPRRSSLEHEARDRRPQQPRPHHLALPRRRSQARYRIIDFKRDKIGVPAKVASIEYDPNRTARIALLHYADGEKRYILAPDGLERRRHGRRRAATPTSSRATACRCATSRSAPMIHNVELKIGKGAQLVPLGRRRARS